MLSPSPGSTNIAWLLLRLLRSRRPRAPPCQLWRFLFLPLAMVRSQDDLFRFRDI